MNKGLKIAWIISGIILGVILIVIPAMYVGLRFMQVIEILAGLFVLIKIRG